MDVAAITWVVNTRSAFTAGMGGGSRTAHWTFYDMYDGSGRFDVHNYMTGETTRRTVTRPATTAGLCRVWWPAAASGLLTLLAFAITLMRTGQWLVAAGALAQMTARRRMIVVAVLGTESGMVICTMKISGVDPLLTPWLPILIRLLGLHVLALMPV